MLNRSFLILAILSLFFCDNTFAQNTCDLTGFVTYTQGGWGGPGNSTPGKIRDQYFSGVFPYGLKIGTLFTLKLTTAKAVDDFLPQGEAPGIFSQNCVNPLTTTAGVFAGQLVALSMNIGYDNAGKLGTNTLKLENLVISSGTFAGLTVKQLFELANKAISGEATGYSIDQINTAADYINNNFDDGKVNKGYLVCPSKCSLGDKVWLDKDKDGIQDQGEDGILNVTVELYKCNDNKLVATTKTGTNGFYSFTNLVSCCYYIKITVPEGYSISHANQGVDDTKDSDVGKDGKSSCVTLGSGENNMTVDAGLYKTESCTDLAVEKTVSKTNPQCNEVFTYTIKVKNNGPAVSENINVSELLPASLIYVSSSVSQGTYSTSSGQWTVGTLPSGSSATLTVDVKADCSQINSTTIDLGLAKGFNLFVLGNLNQPSADTEGKVAVGGDAYLAGYSVGEGLSGFSGDVLIVGHNLTYISGSVRNGNVVYGNSTNLPQNPVTIFNGTIRKDSPIDFTSASAYLQNLSHSLSSYAVNGVTKFQWGQITLTGTDPLLNVFSVSGSDLSQANSLVIDAPNGSVVLVNISGTSLSMHGGLSINGASSGNVLYNFYQATSLTIQGINVLGTVLAPFADLNFPAGLITGEVIVRSMTGSGQFNNNPFIGNIPVLPEITNTAQIILSNPSSDPNLSNNTSSVTIKVTGSSSGSGGGSSGGGCGNGGTGSWSPVTVFNEILYALAFNGSTIYAGTIGGHVYSSTNYGQGWMNISQGMNASSIWALYACSSSGHFFAATDKGVFSFNGTSWQMTALTGKDVHDLISLNGVLYGATWGSGVYKTTDCGATWTQINSGLEPFIVVSGLTVYKGELYAGTVGGGIFKYSTTTNSWTKTTCGYEVIWTMGSSQTKIFAGSYGDGLYQSTDGLSWTKVTSLPSTTAPYIYSIEIDAAGKIYVSSWTSGVYTSSDNGVSWHTMGLGGCGVTSVVASPQTDKVFASTKEGKIYVLDNKATAAADKTLQIPAKFDMKQNYPNPFNPSTTISFDIPGGGSYTLKVYDLLGQQVAVLLNGELPAGAYSVNFDAKGLPSGIYIYKLSGENVSIIKKMSLIK